MEKKGLRSKVFLVEDHPIVRRGVANLINAESDLTVHGESADVNDALRRIPVEKPDVAVVDLSMGTGLLGLQLIKDLRKSGVEIPILVLSMHDESVYADRVLKAGGQGYVMKAEDTSQIIAAIRKLLLGNVYFSEKVVARLLSQRGSAPANGETREANDLGLSDRELEVLQYLGSGKNTREIAAQLNLSIKTIDSHREHLKEKLGLKHSSELLQYAFRWVQSQS
ncbi:MAG: response regulator transcription factor [Spirochaetes bacterium]|nr:response regulator transcription factor [Spirochaetota bacterium]